MKLGVALAALELCAKGFLYDYFALAMTAELFRR